LSFRKAQRHDPDTPRKGRTIMALMTRRRFGRTALAGSLTAAAAPLSLKRAFAADKIHVGYLHLTSHSPTFIAAAKGYFATHGLDAELVSFQAAEPMAVAIASGDVDFGITAISGGLISLSEKGVVKIIGGALEESPGIEGQKILASKPAYDAGLTSPAKLKGKTFGLTTTGSSFHYMAYKIAQKEGFSDKDMHLKALQKVPAVIAALRSGQIDAWSIVPNIADALTKGGTVHEIGKISNYIPNYQVTTIFTSTANVSKRAELVKRFLAAFEKGVDDYNAALVKKTMSAADSAAIVAMIHKYVYSGEPLEKADPRIRHGAMLIAPNGRLNLSSVKDQVDWLKAEKMVPADVSMGKLVDKSFVEVL
jgi:NitT/TauT family transport system substrate-binding protein